MYGSSRPSSNALGGLAGFGIVELFSGVIPYPVGLDIFGQSDVDSRVLGLCTAVAPRNHTLKRYDVILDVLA